MSTATDDIIQILNPSDCFTLAMDEEIRQENMPGSQCGFALELASAPDSTAIEQRIHEFSQRFPLVFASLQQRGKRFFWCQREHKHPLFHQHKTTDSSNEAEFHHQTVQQLLNHLQARETIPALEFHLIQSANKNTFLMRWIHPFCDAKGADLILRYLCTDDAEQRKQFDFPKLEPLVNQQLAKYRWWQKVLMFIKAKRYISQLDTLQSIIHADTSKAPKQLNFKTFTLSIGQTQAINKLNRQHVGLTGGSLYYIGCFMRALNKMNPDQAGEAYCTPYAFNLRRNKALSPLLSNHVAPLFAQAPKSLLPDRAALFQHLKQQNTNTIREKLDYAFLPIMWAASWLSLAQHGEKLRNSMRTGTDRSSFWFSDIGNVNLSNASFFNSDITKIYHLCQISSPPAIAFLSCQFNQQLTLSYNFIEPLFTEEQIEALHKNVLEELLTE
ncbi:hypothetical protein BJAS_P2933 [Bathymodiolus japonicus methanotrophic gill symbiont]|nr:hypothetical protein BJAS_P2933 [Bathymodiolus japonicus methanotrophic gill symbiont]